MAITIALTMDLMASTMTAVLMRSNKGIVTLYTVVSKHDINGHIWCCFLLLITSYSAELQIRTLEKHGGNIPNLLRAENPENRMGQYSKSFDEGWESRKLFCPVQLMLGLGSNGLLKFREKRKVRQALGKGEKEWSDKLFPFTFWCCLKLLFPLFTQCPLAGKYVTASPQSAVFYTRLDFGPGTRGWFNPVRSSCTVGGDGEDERVSKWFK